MTAYNYVYSNGFQLASDDAYMNWLALKLMVSASHEPAERLKPETSKVHISSVAEGDMTTVSLETMSAVNAVEQSPVGLVSISQQVPPAPDTSRDLSLCSSPADDPEAQSTETGVEYRYG